MRTKHTYAIPSGLFTQCKQRCIVLHWVLFQVLSLILHSSGTLIPSMSGLERSAIRWETAHRGRARGVICADTLKLLPCSQEWRRVWKMQEPLSENVSGGVFIMRIESHLKRHSGPKTVFIEPNIKYCWWMHLYCTSRTIWAHRIWMIHWFTLAKLSLSPPDLDMRVASVFSSKPWQENDNDSTAWNLWMMSFPRKEENPQI